jgi:uncharacterized cofD-like protein
VSRPGKTAEIGRGIETFPGSAALPTETVPRAGSVGRRHPRVVAIGGGTGLPILLRGLKAALFPPEYPWQPARDGECLKAIVTVADDGGSSGRLRRAYRLPAPGDVRDCLLALADDESALAAVFDFRFKGTTDVGGHSLGNLILTALHQLEPSFCAAVERGGKLLGIRGRVLPSTDESVVLRAEFEDGSRVEGETRIASTGRLIRRLTVHPELARALPEAREAIGAADLIVIGPGSLYTSLIAPLLLKDLADDIAQSPARVVLVMNLMTEPGETDGYTAVDHLVALRRHAPQVPIHDVLLNMSPIPEKVVAHYAAGHSVPVSTDAPLLRALGCRTVEGELFDDGVQVRHDPRKLAEAILALAPEAR